MNVSRNVDSVFTVAVRKQQLWSNVFVSSDTPVRSNITSFSLSMKNSNNTFVTVIIIKS